MSSRGERCSTGGPRILEVCGIKRIWYEQLIQRTVEVPGSPTYPTIALDSEGHPHVAYYEDQGRNLAYTYFDGDEWVTR